MRRPFTALRSPRVGLRSDRMTRNQYIPCDCARRSFAPRHSGNPPTTRCDEQPRNSRLPSLSAASAFSTGTTSSRPTSRPSCLNSPSSTAAITGKYEFEIRSGIAIFISLPARCPVQTALVRRRKQKPCHFGGHKVCIKSRHSAFIAPGHTMTTAIPVLSLKPIIEGATNADAIVARELLPVLESWGAFQLVDHGVPASVMRGAFKSAERFFQLPLEQRLT